MIKIVFIIICVLIFAGMIALDLFISHDTEKSRSDDEKNGKEKGDEKQK